MTHEKHHHPHSHEHHKPQDVYWKRAHRDWKFWLAITLMLTSMVIYIVTMDEAIRPDHTINQPVP